MAGSFLAGLLGLLLVSAPVDASGEPALDLVGTWYVLVHYQETEGADPDRWHWTDRIWAFERTGSRIRWEDYPWPVFQDESTRFDRKSHAKARRLLGAWEPSEAQWDEIRSGMEVHPGGVRSKFMKVDGPVWRSISMAPRSLRLDQVAYEERWTLENATMRPLFRWVDTIGDGLKGNTEYRTERVEGSTLRGVYARDGRFEGRFQMHRAGAIRVRESDRVWRGPGLE